MLATNHFANDNARDGTTLPMGQQISFYQQK